MMTGLSIQNIALIKNLNISFKKGLNIITGETGSGKSIMINSIKAVIGDRAYREMIRTGCDSATVKAEFLPEPYIVDAINALGFTLAYDMPLILYREIYRSGKNVCKVNNTVVTVSMLNEVGAILVDVHGQFDSRSLVSPETHIQVLDQFGYKQISGLLEKYTAQLNLFKETMQKLKRYALSETELQRKIDMLEYQINEIESAKLQEHEEEELIEKKSIMSNAEKIVSALQTIDQLLFNGENNASSMLNESVSLISSISKYKKEFQDMEVQLKDMNFGLEDLKYSINRLSGIFEFNPGELDAISDRLEAIKSLKKKYGDNILTILEYCNEARDELELLKNSEDIIKDLRSKLESQKRRLYDIACEINAVRRETASSLEIKIAKELDDMEMKKVLFKTAILFPDYEQVSDTDFSDTGLDNVEFLISPNQGEELKPLAKIASGGEISRIMLAVKTLLSDRNKIPVMIFDEIDSGISGEAALQTGRKIYDISKSCQVICVTHMPQIACMADTHYVIKKENIDGNSYTSIQELGEKNRAEQLASLLDGNSVTESGLNHANDMLEKAEEYKTRNIIC